MIPRTLGVLGSGVYGSYYLDDTSEPEHEARVIDALAHHLSSSRLMLQFAQLRRGACLVSRLADSLSRQRWRLVDTQINGSPLIPAQGQTFEAYLSTLGSSHRYNFARRLRNLEKSGGFRFDRDTS